jgi:hypothetical protein
VVRTPQTTCGIDMAACIHPPSTVHHPSSTGSPPLLRKAEDDEDDAAVAAHLALTVLCTETEYTPLASGPQPIGPSLTRRAVQRLIPSVGMADGGGQIAHGY